MTKYSNMKAKVFNVEVRDLEDDLNNWFKKVGLIEIISQTQTQSDYNNVVLTILYRVLL